MLKPGQQAQISNNGADKKIKVVNDIDMEGVTAWKDGYFVFRKQNIQSIMRQIARWYDVEVEYKGTPAKAEFYGDAARSVNLSSVFAALEAAGDVHFKLEGKKVIVSK